MTTREILVFGASGHGKVVADIALAAGYERVVFADDDLSKRGLVLASLASEVVCIGSSEVAAYCASRDIPVALGIGSNKHRQEKATELLRLGLRCVALVHPRACVARSVSVGDGSVVMAGAVVNVDARIGRFTILNTGSTVDHDCDLGEAVHISPGAHLGGSVNIGEGTHVGIGASVRNNLSVGCWSTIGAGAAVVGPIPDRVVAFGVPCRVASGV
jgi:sugar O-acyltransferase (sialic acid O-acetyltransferase NeuD family)